MVAYQAPQQQIRLLSPRELKNTVFDLTQVELSAELNFGDYSTGYDTGSGVKLGEDILVTLMGAMESVASNYVSLRLNQAFPCFSENPVTDQCVQSWIREFSLQAYRGYSDAELQEELFSHFQRLSRDTDLRSAVSLLTLRILLSPRFLYRTEMGEQQEDGRIWLNDLERASLVSYALTGSMPDQALLQDALENQLDEATLRSHVRRLLQTERGRERVSEFFQYWLRLYSLNNLKTDANAAPKFEDSQVAASLLDEFRSFVQSVVIDGDSRLSTLFLSNHTFVNRHTAPLYGLSSSSDQMERVNLRPRERQGILTLASFLSVHASEVEDFRDSPTERGILVKEQLLCETVGLPSGIDVDSATQSILETHPNFRSFTVREQFELMMEQGPSCVACHSQFMPFGYLFGNYNALGQFVTVQNDRPIQASVDNLQAGEGIRSAYGSIVELVPDLVRDPRLSHCFAKNLVRYTLGYSLGEDFESISWLLGTHLQQNNLVISSLFEELYSSPLIFQRRSVTP